MSLEMTCPHCQKPYILKEFAVGDYTSKIPVPQCDCEEREMARLEAAEKERERLRRIAALNLPAIFEPFRLKDLTCEHAADAQIYVEGFTPRKSKGLFIYGPNGNGKTTLGAVICKELAYRGYRVLFTTMTKTLNAMQEGGGYNQASTATKVLKDLTNYDFVLFDDYGRENYTPLRLQNIFQIVDQLYTHRTVFAVTVNPECMDRLQNIPELAAIEDRMTQVLMRWKFTKPSMRRAAL